MRVARAVVIAVLTALVIWFAVTPSNAVAEPSAPLMVYAYDGLAHTAPANDATSGRGPPAEYDRGNAYEAVDQWSLGASVRPDGPARPATYRYNDYNDTALLVRAAAGRATTQGLAVATHGALSSLKPSGVAANTKPWLRGTHGNAGHVPTLVRTALSGRSFNSWDEFRSEFWMAASRDPALASQFSKSNQRLMSQGNAPFVHPSQTFAGRSRYQLHHVIPRSRGGGAYDLDNIVVVTPRYHRDVLNPSYHYGGGAR